jgi:hypothetical protein
VAQLAKIIVDKNLGIREKNEFTDQAWGNGMSKWSAFYGINNMISFLKTIDQEIYKIIHPDIHKATPTEPVTQRELRQVQDLPLYEIRQRFPELGEKLTKDVFDKFTDAGGYYFSAQSGYRSKNKLDFQIDHIFPMSKGGKTVPENLQLLTRAENKIKGDK